MQNFLREYDLEYLSTVFREKNIDLATLEMLNDDSMTKSMQESLHRML